MEHMGMERADLQEGNLTRPAGKQPEAVLGEMVAMEGARVVEAWSEDSEEVEAMAEDVAGGGVVMEEVAGRGVVVEVGAVEDFLAVEVMVVVIPALVVEEKTMCRMHTPLCLRSCSICSSTARSS